MRGRGVTLEIVHELSRRAEIVVFEAQEPLIYLLTPISGLRQRRKAFLSSYCFTRESSSDLGSLDMAHFARMPGSWPVDDDKTKLESGMEARSDDKEHMNTTENLPSKSAPVLDGTSSCRNED